MSVLERLDDTTPDVLRVLCYHRIARPDPDSQLYPGTLSATPESFERQIAYLASRWRPVSIADVLACRRYDRPLPARAVLVTFDDAYDDFEEHAWPVLRHHDTPVVLFVPTAFPDDGEFWWDRLYRSVLFGEQGSHLELDFACLPLANRALRERAFRWLQDIVKALPHDQAMRLVEEIVARSESADGGSHRGRVLGWEALRRLAAQGVDIGSHTRTHPLLNRVTSERTLAEISSSLADLKRELGQVAPVLAYPSGGFGPATARVVAEAGIELAFTTRRGVNRVSTDDPLLLRRILIGPRTSQPVLRAEMLRWSTMLGRWRAPSHLRSSLASQAGAYGVARSR